jgi:hypothetical protein
MLFMFVEHRSTVLLHLIGFREFPPRLLLPVLVIINPVVFVRVSVGFLRVGSILTPALMVSVLVKRHVQTQIFVNSLMHYCSAKTPTWLLFDIRR